MFPIPNYILACVMVAACLASGNVAEADEPTEGRDAAIAAIQKLGGTVEYGDRRKAASLRDCKIIDADLKHLKELPDLTDLELRGTPITDAGLAHLKGLTKLEDLNLYDTTVGDAGLEHLKGLKKLRFLMLKQTNVTDAGFAKIKQALPNCDVIGHSSSSRTPAPPAIFLPAGKWSVEFANGVKQTCAIRADGTASVVEPRRTSGGKATAVKGGAVVLVFEDDVVERWTPVGKRYVVQFWVSGSQFPTATPLLGIAERAP